MEKLFFEQTRAGKDGLHFQIYKIQTMYPHDGLRVDAHGRKIEGDELVIPTRAWLRKTGLDEVPQFVNMILGDMSFFGARAIPPRQLEHFRPLEKERYMQARPGLIGAYLFHRQGGYCHDNPRKANDAYLRLRKRKNNNMWQLIRMNTEALKRSILVILKGDHI